MVKIQFYALDLESDENLKIYGKTLDNKRVCAIDKNYKPSFYALGKDIEKLKKKISLLEEDESKVTEALIEDVSYYDEKTKALRVYTNNLKAITVLAHRIRQDYPTLDLKETDISAYKRYLIDNNLTPLTLWEVDGDIINHHELNVEICVSGKITQVSDDIIPNPRVLALDIEVYGFDFGGDKGSVEPIIMLSLVGSHNYKKVITWKRFKNPQNYIEFVDSEMALLEKANEEILKYNPDYLLGYFSDGFDFPYIEKRMKKYKIKSKIGYDNKGIKIRNNTGESIAKLKGISHIDVYKFVSGAMSVPLDLDSYSLDIVAKELLGRGKVEVNINKLSESWDKGDIKKFCEYNLMDSILTLEIFQKILPNINELVKLIGSPIQETSRMTYGQLVEHYLMKRCRDFKEIIPKRPPRSIVFERRMHTYQGALVMEPLPGLHENLVFLDFRSLYPTVTIAKNISPSTLRLHPPGYETPEIRDESGRSVVYYFDKNKEGFIPKILRDIIQRRNTLKEITKKEPSPVLNARSYALKTIANSTYGYMGFAGARWYCRECSSSITAWAREYITQTIEDARKEKFKVIYSDTDSVAIVLENKTRQDILKFIEKTNKKLPDLMELELESFYKRGIFVYKKGELKGAKKKYALITEKNEIKIKGFETVRGDWSKIARKTQYDVLKLILEGTPKEKAMKYVLKVIDDLRNNKVNKEDLVIQTQLKMNLDEYSVIGPHVAIAKIMKERGFRIGAGSPVWYIVGEGSGKIRDNVCLPDECKNYSKDYYINNQIIPAVEKIFMVLGYTKEDILKDKKQSSLGDF